VIPPSRRASLRDELPGLTRPLVVCSNRKVSSFIFASTRDPPLASMAAAPSQGGQLGLTVRSDVARTLVGKIGYPLIGRSAHFRGQEGLLSDGFTGVGELGRLLGVAVESRMPALCAFCPVVVAVPLVWITATQVPTPDPRSLAPRPWLRSYRSRLCGPRQARRRGRSTPWPPRTRRPSGSWSSPMPGPISLRRPEKPCELVAT